MIYLILRGNVHQRFVHLGRAAIFHHSSGWMKWCLLLFFISQITFSQEHLGRVTSDFRISSDSTPSTFVQSGIQLFPGPDSGFIAMWEDYREGDITYYAQKFDRLGNKIGKNYKSPFNQSITYLSDGSSLRIDTTIIDNPWDPRLWVTGNVYDSNGNSLGSMPLGSAFLPWCGTGYLGIDYHYAQSKENFYFLFSDDGRLSLSRIHKHGGLTSISSESLQIYGAYSSSINATSNDGYVIAWSRLNHIEINDSDGFRTNNIMESWGSFYGTNDTVYKKRVPLGLFTDTMTIHQYTGINKYSSFLRSIFLRDSVYEVFGIQSVPLSILYRTFDRYGNPLDTVKNIPLSFVPDQYGGITNLIVSEVRDNLFKVMLGAYRYETNGNSYYYVIMNFDLDGNPVGEPFIDTPRIPMRGDHIINISENTTIIGIEKNNDVFLVRYQGLTPVDSMKVNDDVLGSNESYSKVISFSSSENFVVWKNEQQYYGKVLSTGGEYVGPVQPLDGYWIKFFQNSTSVNLWYRDTVPRFSIGFTVRDANWNITNTTILINTEYRNAPNHSYVLEKLTDSTFVVGYAISHSILVLKLFNVSGELLAEHQFTSVRSIYGSEIIVQDSTSFTLRCSGESQKFSLTLQPLTEKLPCIDGLYLTSDLILSTEQDYLAKIVYGRLHSPAGDTLSERFVLSRGTYDVQTFKLTYNTFIALMKNGNTLYARTFNIYGQVDHDSTVIYTSEFGGIRNPTCTVSGDDILFTWAEKRPTGRGYDIYGTTVGISNLLSIPNNGGGVTPHTLTLFQNYPNPFNPTTTIRYITTEPGDVTLSIFDVLGREVIRLVDGYQYMGEHIIEWNAEGVPSGVYFYRVTTNNFTEMKKLLLLR